MMMRKIKKIIQQYKLKKANKYWDRLADAVKKKLSSCGTNLTVLGEIEVFSGENISIGNNCKINPDVFFNGRSGITIGDNVTLSHGAKLISTGYDVEHWMETGERVHIDDKPIHIGDNCWLGANAIILPGVKITGEYVVIGAGAVVTKDVTESRVLVAGNPAKIVKHYDVKNQG